MQKWKSTNNNVIVTCICWYIPQCAWHVYCCLCTDPSPTSWGTTWIENIENHGMDKKTLLTIKYKNTWDGMSKSAAALSYTSANLLAQGSSARTTKGQISDAVYDFIRHISLGNLCWLPSGWLCCFPKYRLHFSAPGDFPCQTCTSCMQPPVKFREEWNWFVVLF